MAVTAWRGALRGKGGGAKRANNGERASPRGGPNEARGIAGIFLCAFSAIEIVPES